MQENRFDALAKALASGNSRRDFLKVLGGSALGAVATVAASSSALAFDPLAASPGNGHCKDVGDHCGHGPNGSKHCCSGFCDSSSGLCGCPPASVECPSGSGTCVSTTCTVVGAVFNPLDCQCECLPGQTQCGNVCVNLAVDGQNCGGCGHVCPTGATCAGGACVCPPGQVICNDACTPLGTNQNCAGCGNACPLGTTCQNGICTSICPIGKPCYSSLDCGPVAGSNCTCVGGLPPFIAGVCQPPPICAPISCVGGVSPCLQPGCHCSATGFLQSGICVA